LGSGSIFSAPGRTASVAPPLLEEGRDGRGPGCAVDATGAALAPGQILPIDRPERTPTVFAVGHLTVIAGILGARSVGLSGSACRLSWLRRQSRCVVFDRH
jgi:hypothetical protein